MHRIICFHTSMFDVTKEDANTINPIPGQSLLVWLRNKAQGVVEIGTPDCEDWGWYVVIDWKGREVTLGASAETLEGGMYEWYFHVASRRTFKEWLTRRQDIEGPDCFEYFRSIVESESEFQMKFIE